MILTMSMHACLATTGKLPIEVDMNAFSDEQEAMLQSSRFSEELPPPIPPKNY